MELVHQLMERLKARYGHEPEFLQAVYEVAKDVLPYEQAKPEYRDARIFERLTEPDRAIAFRVVWVDDQGKVQINRGYRVQMSNALGPYKGGLRFHPSVNLGMIKFLAFEQIFKNSLTGLALGAGKGGADFNPHGRSDSEIMRFCQAFMLELYRHIGRYIDVPAGDIGVGSKEVGYMYGMLVKLRGHEPGAFTGKILEHGGSLLRPEATGYGCVYFAQEMLARQNDSIEGKTAVISGAGNVAQHAAEKLIQMGAKVLTLSDSTGMVHIPQGLTEEQLAFVKALKQRRGTSLKSFAEEYKLNFYPKERPWKVPAELAFPCATQNELDLEDAKTLIKNGCRLVAEGANMPCTPEAVEAFEEAGVLFGPGKAANAGGVAVSGIEMQQNASRVSWTKEEVDYRLRTIMRHIHEQCVAYGEEKNGKINYMKGANIAGYERVARAILAYGIL